MKLFLAALWLAAPAHATFVVVRGPHHQIWAGGSDCAELRRQKAVLAQWKAKLDERPYRAPKRDEKCAPTTPTSEAPFAKYALRLDDAVPGLLKRVEGICPTAPGPNCWNATLVASEILPHLRYAEHYEMSFWMNSPLCRAVKAREKLAPGDVIAIRYHGEEEHGFVYLSEEMSFSKNGYTTDSSYELQSPRDVFNLYEVPTDCRRADPNSSVDRFRCPRQANYFRCQSLGSYLKTYPQLAKKYRCMTEQFSKLEAKVSRSAFREAKSCPNLKQLRQDICRVGGAKSKSCDAGFLDRSLEIRSEGTLHQIKLMEEAAAKDQNPPDGTLPPTPEAHGDANAPQEP